MINLKHIATSRVALYSLLQYPFYSYRNHYSTYTSSLPSVRKPASNLTCVIMLTSLGDSENGMKDVYLYYSAMIKKTTFWMKESLLINSFLHSSSTPLFQLFYNGIELLDEDFVLDMDPLGLAQYYGFHTEVIDFTSDIRLRSPLLVLKVAQMVFISPYHQMIRMAPYTCCQ